MGWVHFQLLCLGPFSNVRCTKGTCHKAYAPIGVQIARLKPTGGKDSGGEIVRMKYRISQYKSKVLGPQTATYSFLRTFSLD